MGVVQLLIGAGGIYASFLYYGSLQEDVLTYKGASGEKFDYAWLLQVLEAGANVVLGLLCMLIMEGARFGAISAPAIQVPYLISGALQVTAKYLTTASMIAGVSFPVATLGKSSKMVPVMMGQLLLGKASYSTREYIHVLMIVGGTGAVSMAGKSKPGTSTGMGLLLLCGALGCDGIVGGTQKRLKAALKDKGMKERNFEMQFLTNLYMMVTAIIFTSVMGEFAPGVEFLRKHPGIFIDILKFAACSAAGQAFIFYTISTFDPLVCTTVTTTRKVFSVLISIFTKGHQLNGQGWAGIAAACCGILGELEQKYSESKKKSKESPKQSQKKESKKSK